MPVEGFKTVTVSERVYQKLEEYKGNRHLRSIAQAIEWLIREAGYTLNEPLLEESGEVKI